MSNTKSKLTASVRQAKGQASDKLEPMKASSSIDAPPQQTSATPAAGLDQPAVDQQGSAHKASDQKASPQRPRPQPALTKQPPIEQPKTGGDTSFCHVWPD